MHWGGTDFSLSKGGLKVNSPVLWMVLSFSFILSFPFLMVVCVHMPPPIHTVHTQIHTAQCCPNQKARGSKKPCNDTCPMEGDHTVRRKIFLGLQEPCYSCSTALPWELWKSISSRLGALYPHNTTDASNCSFAPSKGRSWDGQKEVRFQWDLAWPVFVARWEWITSRSQSSLWQVPKLLWLVSALH